MYLRLLRSSPGPSLQAEQLELAEVLNSAPGTSNIEVVGLHPKGGYRVTFDLAQEAMDAFISHIEASAWRSVF